MKYFFILPTLYFLFSCSSQLSDPRYTASNGGNLAPPPVLKIHNLQGQNYIKGGSIYNVRFTVTDAIGYNSNRLEYSKDNGANWQLMISATGQNAMAYPSLTGEETFFDWAVPQEPSCSAPTLVSDSNQYKIRIFSSGRPDAQVTYAESAATFTVDSCAPVLAADQFIAGVQNKGFIQFTINNISDAYVLSPVHAVCIKTNSSIAPLPTDSCWRSLQSLRISSSATPSTIQVNYFLGFISGTFNFYLWAMDQAGNISTNTANSGSSLIDSSGLDYINAIVRDCSPSSECTSTISQSLTANVTSVGSALVTKSGAPDISSIQTLIDPHFFILTAQGTLIFRDANTKSIKKINLLNDTIATTLIPNGASAIDGNQSIATVQNPVRLGIDFDENLYILDNNKIRKVTFSSDNLFDVTTIVGGGANNISQTFADPLDLQISSFDKATAQGASQYWYGTFEVLQDSRIYFSASDPQNIFDVNALNRSQIKIYDVSAINKIKSIDFSGDGVQGSASQSTTNLVPYSNFGLIFNSTFTVVQNLTTRLCEAVGSCNSHQSATFNSAGVSVGATGHAFLPSQWGNANYFNSRKGELYNSNAYDARLFKYNILTQNWDNKLGTGVYGVSYCADGTSALSCSVRLWDSFVGYNDQIFFIDQGRLRFVDLDGKVKTLTQ